MSLGWLRCIPLQLVLAAVAVETCGTVVKFVAQMLKLDLSFMKVSVVAAGADDCILLPCFECS